METQEMVTIKLTKAEADALINILLKVKKVHDGEVKIKRCKN